MKTLPKIPDRSEIYYKITNNKERHHGLQYHDGLIIDPERFNNDLYASCVRGGIYFTTSEYLHKFFCYGEIIRPVTIPSDAKVLLDPHGDKYRADRLFFRLKKDMDFYFDSLFDKAIYPVKAYWCLAENCPNHFDVWFDKKTFPINDYWRLAVHCSANFDKWFDRKTFPKKYYWCLAMHCFNYFYRWFDKKAFPTNDYWYLTKYCKKYEHIWGK